MRGAAYIQWDAAKLKELADIPQELIDKAKDLTPVMIVVATDDLKPDMLAHLDSQGEGSWDPKSPATKDRDKRRGVSSSQPGIGQHGGFGPTVQRSWSSRNAVAFTKAPHAHLFSLGTKQYRSAAGVRQFAYGSKATGRRSRPSTRAFLLNPNTVSGQHQPPRPFDYISDDVQERSMRRVAAFIVGDPFDGAV